MQCGKYLSARGDLDPGVRTSRSEAEAQREGISRFRSVRWLCLGSLPVGETHSCLECVFLNTVLFTYRPQAKARMIFHLQSRHLKGASVSLPVCGGEGVGAACPGLLGPSHHPLTCLLSWPEAS